jgi:hypothetical protein
MSNIKEDYVSFDVAKLLKNKGFDGGCDMYYTETGSVEYTQLRFNHNEIKNHYSRPTHQMVMKWLREKYKIFIEIGVSIDINEVYAYSFCILDKICKYLKRGDKVFYRTYEDACEASIKYTLENLI